MHSFEELEHTADTGLRLCGDDLPALFRAAAEGFTALVLPGALARADARASAASPAARSLHIEARAVDLLLRSWLAALLNLLALEKMLVVDVAAITVSETSLEADVRLLPLSPADERDATEIKAVTYHGLFARRTENGWLAEVIFDT
jgi:SHS2 domain-containing protein